MRTRIKVVLILALGAFGMCAYINFYPKHHHAKELPFSPPQELKDLPADDQSLPDTGYVALGFPPSDRNWDAADLSVAAAKLEEIANSRPEQLPIFQSPKSGRLFAKFIDPYTLGLQQTGSTQARIDRALAVFNAYRQLVPAYDSERSNPKVYAESMVELEGAMLRIVKTILQLSQQQYFSVRTDDPDYLTRTAGYSKVRDAAGLLAYAAVLGATDSRPQFSTITARSKLLDYCSETVPEITKLQNAKHLKPIIDTLDSWADAQNPDVLLPKVIKLRDQVAAGTSNGVR